MLFIITRFEMYENCYKCFNFYHYHQTFHLKKEHSFSFYNVLDFLPNDLLTLDCLIKVEWASVLFFQHKADLTRNILGVNEKYRVILTQKTK